jgi:RimJ/RimL family protein N-acetyltransferase
LSALRIADAAEMVDVLAAAELYEFIGGTAPSEAELRERYRAQVLGPPDATEQWHNWIVRLAGHGPAIGYVQATVRGDRADVAWVIGQPWQGCGYAAEATRAMLAWLTASTGVHEVIAQIHPDHSASQRVASSAGLQPTRQLTEGEEIWRWPIEG